ncbi:MAG: PAS domain S-box protein [Nitrospira sp.]|nr:PAS domain S-box protein [Nitrospira sp.]
MFWKDRESRFLGCNQNFARDAGCVDAQEIVGKTDDDLAWHKQAALYQADDRQVMESGCAKLDFEEPGTTQDGELIWLRTSKVPLRDEQGCVIGVLGVYEDITERKQVDEALRESQERFELAAQAANDGIWDWDILTGDQYWSERHLQLLGLERSTFTPTYASWISLVHPDDAKWVQQATQHHLDTHEPYDIEVRVRIKDGSYRWFRDRGQAVWDASGRPVRMVGSISDVTERRQAEEAIWKAHAELEQRVVERTMELAAANRALEEEIVQRKRAEDRLQRTQYAVDHAADQIFVIDSNGHLLDVNESACNRLGYTKEELLTMSVMDIDPDFPPEAWNACWAAVTREGQRRIETRHRSKSGEIYPVEVVANYLCHNGQELDCAIVRDITERKRAEELVRASELRYKILTEATFDGVALHDEGVLLEVNPGLERMFGYGPGELIGRSIVDLIADESRDMVIANMRSGVNGPYEAMARRKDGTIFPGEVVVRPYHYRGKEVRLVAGRDITERKHLEVERLRYTHELERQVAERTAEIAKLESQRAQTEKLAAMGRLAAGVAHEINNPIAGIKNAFTLVKQAVDQAHPHYEFVGMIDREIARVSSIVQHMYQLFRPESGKAEPIDLQTMTNDIQALFAKRLQQRRLTLTIDVDPCLERLCVPRGDLLQVLLNLLNNAIDCSRDAGRITLILRVEPEMIRVAVSDEGAGIPPDVLPHIFDPFYTTKMGNDQKNMGLGLSVSRSLVMAMGATIDVETQPNQGSIFSILIPRDKAVVSVREAEDNQREAVIHEN